MLRLCTPHRFRVQAHQVASSIWKAPQYVRLYFGAGVCRERNVSTIRSLQNVDFTTQASHLRHCGRLRAPTGLMETSSSTEWKQFVYRAAGQFLTACVIQNPEWTRSGRTLGRNGPCRKVWGRKFDAGNKIRGTLSGSTKHACWLTRDHVRVCFLFKEKCISQQFIVSVHLRHGREQTKKARRLEIRGWEEMRSSGAF